MNKKLTLLVDGMDRPFILLILFTIVVFFAGITPSFSSDDYVHLLNNTKFNNINESKLKNYCIQSFLLNSDLSKEEEMRCVGNDSSIDKNKFKFDIVQLGYNKI